MNYLQVLNRKIRGYRDLKHTAKIGGCGKEVQSPRI